MCYCKLASCVSYQWPNQIKNCEEIVQDVCDKYGIGRTEERSDRDY